MNPLLQGHSRTTPEPSRNALSNSQGTNEDDSQNDPHPEAGLFHGQMAQNSGAEDGHDNYYTNGMVILQYTKPKITKPKISKVEKISTKI